MCSWFLTEFLVSKVKEEVPRLPPSYLELLPTIRVDVFLDRISSLSFKVLSPMSRTEMLFTRVPPWEFCEVWLLL